jgi:hypothetical protein
MTSNARVVYAYKATFRDELDSEAAEGEIGKWNAAAHSAADIEKMR